MSDTVVGIAVLHHHQILPDEVGWLYFISRRGNGKVFCNYVTIVRAEDYDHIKALEPNRQLWSYRIEGDVLHCKPSVNMPTAGWHNSYDWSVRFVRNPDDKKYCWNLLRELNDELLQNHEE